MQAGNKHNDAQRDMLIVEKPEAIRLLFSEKHNRVLKKITERELSISDIARSLNINPGSVHYHLKELEKQGLARQVRQEIKGGIVKKYYRSAAKHFCLESPDFDADMRLKMDLAGDFIEKLIHTIGLMGYTVSDENRAEAIEMLTRYDRRIKELFRELLNPDVDAAVREKMIAVNACQFLINMRVEDDPELRRISSQFSKLFLQVQ